MGALDALGEHGAEGMPKLALEGKGQEEDSWRTKTCSGYIDPLYILLFHQPLLPHTCYTDFARNPPQFYHSVPCVMTKYPAGLFVTSPRL